MALKDEDLKFNIVINGNQAQKDLVDLTVKTRNLRDEKQKLTAQGKQDTQQFKDLTKAIKQNEAQLTVLRKSIGLNALSMKDLVAEQRRLKAAMFNISPKTKDWKNYNTELIKVNKRLGELRGASNSSSTTISKLASGMSKFQSIGIATIAVITGLVFSISSLVQGNYDLSESFADVSKTADMTIEQVQQLYGDLRKIDTRTSNKQLLELAETAGRLGIRGSANIRNFVNEADKIQVALGDILGQDAIKDIGKLANIFDTNMTKIGNTINKLGASSQAQEGYIVDFLKRTAGAGKNAGLSIDQLAGFGATLDSLGQSVETSGTIISKTIIDMFTNTEDYAKVAGMGLQEFSNILNTDANEALIKVLEGLKGNNEGMQEMSGRLDTLGVDGARGVAVLATLADKTELLREQQSIANEEYKNGSSMLDEFNKKNENFAAIMDKLSKRFTDMFVNSSIMKGLESTARWIDDLTKTKLSDTLRKEQFEFNALIRSINNSNTPTETRKDLIKTLNEQYSEYLPNLITEKTSIEDIATAQANANKEFEKKIQLQAAEEIFAEQGKKAIEAQKALYDATIELGQAEEKFNKLVKEKLHLYGGQAGLKNFYVADQGRVKRAKIAVAELSEEVRKETEAYQKLYETLDLGSLRAASGDTNVTIPGKPETTDAFSPVTSDKRVELLERLKQLQFEYELSQKESLDRQIAEVNKKYDDEVTAAKGNNDIIIQLEKLRRDEIFSIITESDKADNDEKIKKEKEFQEKRNALIEQYNILTSNELKAQELNKLKEYYDLSLLTTEEYEIAKQQILQEYNKIELEKEEKLQAEKLAKRKEYVASVEAISGYLSNAVTSLIEYETLKAGDNEAEKLAIKKKYADLQFGADAASIISSTAVAIMQGFAELGPIGGGIAAVLLGADGVLQLAISNEQREQVKQLAKGDMTVWGEDDGMQYTAPFTPKLATGIVSRPTLVGEKPEIVVDTETSASIMLHEPQLISAIMRHKQVPQMASGNYPSYTNTASATTDTDLKNILAQSNAIMSKMISVLNKPIRAEVSLYGTNGLYEAEDLDSQINSDINV